MKSVQLFYRVVGLCLLFCASLSAYDAVFPLDNEYCLLMSLSGEETDAEIQKNYEDFLNEWKSEQQLALNRSNVQKRTYADVKGELPLRPDGYRDYWREVTPKERADISYIMESIANKNPISLGLNKSSLDAAGDRVRPVHPLRYLMTVFDNENLKVCIRVLRSRRDIKMPWNRFLNETAESFADEDKYGNLTQEQLEHFAKAVDIDIAIIQPSFNRKQWKQFINTLIDKIPRKGDYDIYDMRVTHLNSLYE